MALQDGMLLRLSSVDKSKTNRQSVTNFFATMRGF